MEQEDVREDVQDTISYDEAEETTEETAEAPEPEQEETPEERKARIEFTEEQQKYINDHIVARQVAKRKEVERELEELRQKAQQAQPQQDDGRPTIPDPPNIWDDDYEAKIKARDEAIREATAWETRQREREQWEYQQAQLQEQQKQQELIERVGTYTTRAKDYGIDEKDLQVAGNAVSQYGIPEPLVEFILDDDAGPAITMHLSRNLQELEELGRMDPIRAAVYVATHIKPRATKNAKRRSAPPEPVDNPKGGGVPEKDRGPKGAVYE